MYARRRRPLEARIGRLGAARSSTSPSDGKLPLTRLTTNLTFI